MAILALLLRVPGLRVSDDIVVSEIPNWSLHWRCHRGKLEYNGIEVEFCMC